MRTVVQALREVLDPRVIQPGPLELREEDEGSTLPPVRLEHAGQSVALRFRDWAYTSNVTIPVNRWLFPLFDITRSKPPVCRSCDYIIFHLPRNAGVDCLFVLLCELKSGRPTGAREQLRNSKLLADYILSVAKFHGGVSSWPSDIRYRGVVIAPEVRGTRGGIRPPAVAEFVEDDRLGPDLRVTAQRPRTSYPIQFFCA